MINRIAAVVALFHPLEEEFSNISTYSKVIKDIIIIDNSGKEAYRNYVYVNKLRKAGHDRNICYYDMKCNKGLAEAFNYGLDIAFKIGCDWCFTMDSSSLFENDIASVYINAEKKYGGPEIIAYAPQYGCSYVKARRNNIKKITCSIISGTMFNVKKVIEAGGFDKWYCLGRIDVELGYRLKKSGYKILRCNAAILKHSSVQTVNRNLFGKTFKYWITRPDRYYYQAKADMRIMISYFSPYAFLDLFMQLVKIIFLFNRKKEYLAAWKKGLKDGLYNRRKARELLRIKYKLLKYKKVSFDIYDTLIKRDTRKPGDVFYLLAQEYICEFGENKRTAEEIINMRLEAQKQAESNKDTEEISIYDIYMYSGFENKERQFLLDKEMEIEYKLSCRNPLIGEVYDWCIKCKKDVLITSDMYLPQELIEKILEKNNYNEYKKLYLSSSIGKRKSTGNLFKEVYKKENCRATEVVHIGDAKKGDFLKPLLNGSKAVLIKRNMEVCMDKGKSAKTIKAGYHIKIGKNIKHGMLHSFINNRTYSNKNVMSRFGYELTGPIVYGYCRWLHKQKEENNIQHIYFLAREGVILINIYLKIYPEDIDICSVLRVSRHALKKPLEEPDSLQRKYLEQYLLQEGLEKDNIKNSIAVADVGWQGTIQYNLSKILPNTKIYGFYIGFKKNENLDTAYGFLFEKDINRQIQNGVMFTATFFENCFMAPEGSTLQYEQQGNHVIPVLDICEQPDNVSTIIGNIQKGIMQFTEDSLFSGILDWLEKYPDIAASNYLYFMKHINKHMLKEMDKMVSRDGNRDSRITAEHGLLFYIVNPGIFIREFKLNRSKLLFMRSIAACPFYMAILGFLKNIEEKHK